MKNVSVFLLTVLAIAFLSHDGHAQKVGSSSMQFLKVMPCARATALGDAYAVLASGAEAVFWNPASVSRVEGSELSLTYLDWIFDSRQGAASFATSLGSIGAIGFQVQYVDFGEIPEALWVAPYNEDPVNSGLTGRTFRPYAYLVGVSYARQLTDKFSTGLTAKYAHESLYDGSTYRAVNTIGDTIDVNTWANGIMFDFGIWYDTGFRSIKLGASVQNFGPDVTYASEANAIPLSLRVGIAANLIGSNALLAQNESNRLGIAFDLFQPNDYSQQAHAGLEYEFSDVVALRAGYKVGYDADGFTAGLGVKHSFGDMRLAVDYSYGSLQYNLGNVQRISIGAGF